MLKLLIHQWNEKRRSTFWQKSILINVILGILGIYLLLDFLFIGYYADKIIQKLYIGRDVVEVFTGLLFYYFTFDLILRFLFQKLPTLAIKPYLTLPVKKRTLLHYPLIISVSSFFNIIPVILFLPFFTKVVCTTHTTSFCITWIVTVFSLVAANNFLNFALKKNFSKRPLFILLLMAFVAELIYLDVTKTVSCSNYISSALIYLANNPFLVIIPIAIVALTYNLAYFLLKRNSYIEDIHVKQRTKTENFSFLNRYGEIGNLIRIELKMILRNKRPKSMLYVSLIFFAYGFMFYQKELLNNYLTLIFAGMVMTSMFGMNYGQFQFSWESSYFDSYLSNKISPLNYIKSKYLVFNISCIIGYLITLPYAFISYKIGLINAAMLLYSIGVSSFIMLFFCTYNSTSIDLGKSQFMNYQGTGVSQFLLIIPIMGFPLIIYLLFLSLGTPQYTFYVLGIIGIIGLLFNKYLLQVVANQFVKRKYKMAVGFRQK